MVSRHSNQVNVPGSEDESLDIGGLDSSSSESDTDTRLISPKKRSKGPTSHRRRTRSSEKEHKSDDGEHDEVESNIESMLRDNPDDFYNEEKESPSGSPVSEQSLAVPPKHWRAIMAFSKHRILQVGCASSIVTRPLSRFLKVSSKRAVPLHLEVLKSAR